MTATKTPKLMPSEHEEQKALFEWAAMQPLPGGGKVRDFLFAVPNGGQRSKVTAARLRAEGVTPGVPDVMLAYPCAGSHALFIEMKRARPAPSSVSSAQRDMMSRLSAQGFRCVIAYGAGEAIDAVKSYLSLS